MFILLNYRISINNNLNFKLGKQNLSSVFNGFCLIRIRIPDPAQLLIRIRFQGNYTDSTDPDPQQCTIGIP